MYIFHRHTFHTIVHILRTKPVFVQMVMKCFFWESVLTLVRTNTYGFTARHCSSFHLSLFSDFVTLVTLKSFRRIVHIFCGVSMTILSTISTSDRNYDINRDLMTRVEYDFLNSAVLKTIIVDHYCSYSRFDSLSKITVKEICYRNV